MRICGMCKIEKELSAFGWRSKAKGTYQWACRECQKILRRNHHEENRDKVIARTKARKQDLLDKAWQYKQEHPCVDCGRDNPAGLDFDHLQDKSMGICEMVQLGYSWDKILLEIEKCEVVCAYCHRIRTHNRGGWIRNVTVRV